MSRLVFRVLMALNGTRVLQCHPKGKRRSRIYRVRVSKRKREKRERGLKQTKGGTDAFRTGKRCERDGAGCARGTLYLHLMRGASLYTFEYLQRSCRMGVGVKY